MNQEKTILEVQAEIEAALERLKAFEAQLPDELKPLLRIAPRKGARAKVSLRHAKTDRKVKRNAPADCWSPDSGKVSICYDTSLGEAAHGIEAQVAIAAHPGAPSKHMHAQDPARDLLLALAGAERDPQLGFVSLKWFRDVYLRRQRYPWTTTPENRQRVLVEAINRNWILTSKVPNPKNPQYPVTAIKINRPLPEVRQILDQEEGFGSAFAPITIAGERLSETVLRERR